MIVYIIIVISIFHFRISIPHMFSKRKDSGFPYDCADAAAADGRRGSNVLEVNL